MSLHFAFQGFFFGGGERGYSSSSLTSPSLFSKREQELNSFAEVPQHYMDQKYYL